MKHFNVEITNPFKSKMNKSFNGEAFIASYNQGEYFRILIDRQDGKRVGIKIERGELIKLAEAINYKLMKRF